LILISLPKNEENNEDIETKIEDVDDSAESGEIELTPDERTNRFMQFLHELNLEPFTPYSKATPRLIYDPRYYLLNSQEEKKNKLMIHL